MRRAPGINDFSVETALDMIRISAASTNSDHSKPRILILLDEILKIGTFTEACNLLRELKGLTSQFEWLDLVMSSLSPAAVRQSFPLLQWQPLTSLSHNARLRLIATPLQLPEKNEPLLLLIADTAGHPRLIEAVWKTLHQVCVMCDV